METKKTFMKIEDNLLRNKDLTPTEKLIISQIKRFQDNKIYYYGSQEQLAEELGLPTSTLKKNIKLLKDKKLIFSSTDVKINNNKFIPFNNRKVLIVVDENNPYPTSDEVEDVKVIDNITSMEIVRENEENDIIEEYLQRKLNKMDVVNSIQEVGNKYSEYSIGSFKVSDKYIINGLYNYITKGNDGKEMKGIISKLKKNTSQMAFDYDLEQLFLSKQLEIHLTPNY